MQAEELDRVCESSQIGKMYSRSSLTSAAAHGKGCNVGCFVLQDEQSGARNESKYQDLDGALYDISSQESDVLSGQLSIPSSPVLLYLEDDGLCRTDLYTVLCCHCSFRSGIAYSPK